MIKEALEMPWTLTAGVIFGFLLAPIGPISWNSLLRYYDEAQPVVRMQGYLVSRDQDAIVIQLSGEKLRACEYLRIQAYAVTATGSLEDAYIRREDRHERGDSKPIGTYSLGYWRIWPVYGAQAVRVYVQHDCGGRLVQTRLTEVSLTAAKQ